MVYRRTSKTGNYWKWVSVFLLVFGFFVPILGGLVNAAPKATKTNDVNLTDSVLYNGTLDGGTLLLSYFNASGNIIRDAVLANATLTGGSVFAGDVDAMGYRFLNAVVYNGTLAGGTVFADVVDARGYRLKNAVIDNGTLTNGTVFADAVDARGYQLKNAVVKNATLLDAVVGSGSTASLDMNGNSLYGVQVIRADTGLNMVLQAAPNQCIIAWNGSQGQIWASCDGGAAGWAGRAASFRGNVEPEVNNTYDLGSSSAKWKTVYAVGTSFGDVLIDDQVVLRASDNKLSWYSYDPRTKKLIEKMMELNLLTGDLKVKGKIYEKASFEPLTEEEKRTPFGE